jgi:hypothetical protein
VDLVDLRTVATISAIVVDGGADRGAAHDGQSEDDGEGRQPSASVHETTS